MFESIAPKIYQLVIRFYLENVRIFDYSFSTSSFFLLLASLFCFFAYSFSTSLSTPPLPQPLLLPLFLLRGDKCAEYFDTSTKTTTRVIKLIADSVIFI